jgi:hypothetical protein
LFAQSGHFAITAIRGARVPSPAKYLLWRGSLFLIIATVAAAIHHSVAVLGETRRSLW